MIQELHVVHTMYLLYYSYKYTYGYLYLHARTRTDRARTRTDVHGQWPVRATDSTDVHGHWPVRATDSTDVPRTFPVAPYIQTPYQFIDVQKSEQTLLVCIKKNYWVTESLRNCHI